MSSSRHLTSLTPSRETRRSFMYICNTPELIISGSAILHFYIGVVEIPCAYDWELELELSMNDLLQSSTRACWVLEEKKHLVACSNFSVLVTIRLAGPECWSNGTKLQWLGLRTPTYRRSSLPSFYFLHLSSLHMLSSSFRRPHPHWSVLCLLSDAGAAYGLFCLQLGSWDLGICFGIVTAPNLARFVSSPWAYCLLETTAHPSIV